MAKIYKTDTEAQEALLSGVRQLAKLVTITLGPKGRNVALDRRWVDPVVIHDGVTVAKEVILPDPFENMGAALVREAASKTVDRAGDGTTTATLLAWKLFENGIRAIHEGRNPMIMKDGIDKAVAHVSAELLKRATPVKEGDVEKVATISAANAQVGKTIAETLERVGIDGVVTVEDGVDDETTVEYKEGMMFDKGYGSPYFVTNDKDQIAEIYDPMILLTDMIVDSQQDLTDFLDNVLTEKRRNIVIIAHEFQGMTLPILVNNHQKGTIRCLTVKAPSFGLKRAWMLEDMATLTGGTVILRQSGRTLSSVKFEELGHAEKVWSDKESTKIIGGAGEKEVIQERIEIIRRQIQNEKSEFEKKSLRERLARLASGAAIIHVGAITETELKDKKERIEDAVQATKAAVAEGIVAGGGIALLQCRDSLLHLIDSETDIDVKAGMNLVYSVLEEPFEKIIENAGEHPDVVRSRIALEGQENERDYEISIENYWYDVVSRKCGNMIEMGILDPVKVTRQAIQNAGSVGSMLLTIGAELTEDADEKKMPEQAPMA